MAEKDTWYMHLLNRKPAYFDGEQLVYAEQLPHWQDDYFACRLRKTVATILRDQKRSREYRQKMGFRGDIDEYGYIEVSTSSRLKVHRRARS